MARTHSWLERYAELDAIEEEFIDRATVERVLQVERRRALQLMESLPGKQIGSSKVVSRSALLDRLRALARGAAPEFERGRRERMAQWIEDQRRERIAHPQVLVEAPTAVVNTRLADLPAGVTIAPGRITIAETDGKRAVEKLLAVAMAIGNQFEEFEHILAGR